MFPLNAEKGEVRDELKQGMLDLGCCSIKDNLLFHDIPNINSEDCKHTLRQFMCENIHVRKEINIQRVHRIRQNFTYSNAQPRNIVANVSFFKDRELERNQTPKS